MEGSNYDYLIVGSGLFGSVFAYEANKRGKKCLVIDKRNHLGGNIYNENIGGINVHKYGPHIFHTNDEDIWNYVQQFVTFNRFTYSPLANFKGKYYNLPFNMHTFYQMWGLSNPEEVAAHINQQIAALNIGEPVNLEEQAIKLVGPDIYHTLIKGYTEKQWGRKATELPAFIIKRLPMRFTFDNNYFNDKYQGIPIGGYNKIIEGLLAGIDCKTGVDYFADRYHWDNIAKKVVYTGQIDEYFDKQFGYLSYRSLRFEQEHLEIANYQGVAAVNYTDFETPFTRIIEHKHFEYGTQKTTVITREYPQDWTPGAEPYYPVNDEFNNALAKKYKDLAAGLSDKVIFGGRLAEYIYYDMHQVIASALVRVRKEFGA
jgi:UDP-galactopyranose mutase